MKFEGLYAQERPGTFKKIWGFKASPESFSVKQVMTAFRYSGNHFVPVDKKALHVDAVAL
jgi:hypothetical protein